MHRLSLALPAFAGIGVELLAQANPLDPGITSLIGNGVTIAVLAWYVIYDVRVRTPAMLTAFASEQANMRTQFTSEQANLRKEAAANLELMRQTFHTEQMAVRNHCDAEIAGYRQMLSENLMGMRTAVHDVKNAAAPVINAKDSQAIELAELRKELSELRTQVIDQKGKTPQ